MKINKEELYRLYMVWVDSVPDEKSIFTPKEIVNEIANIIKSNPALIELPSDEEIEKKVNEISWIHPYYQKGFFNGIKWMREQILNQNK